MKDEDDEDDDDEDDDCNSVCSSYDDITRLNPFREERALLCAS